MPKRKAVRADDKRLKQNRPQKPVEEKTRWQQLKDGDIEVEDLDDEEIRRGKCKDVNGNFSGRVPKNFPTEILMRMRAEFQRRVDEEFMPTVTVAKKTLLEVAENKRAAGPARVRAAEVLLERGAGKVADRIEAQVQVKKFEGDFEGILVDVDGEED